MIHSEQVSPDGGLIQSSTLADTWEMVFADGVSRTVPGSYVEFAERRVQPQFQHLQVRARKEQVCAADIDLVLSSEID